MKRIILLVMIFAVVLISGSIPVIAGNSNGEKDDILQEKVIPPLDDITKADFTRCVSPKESETKHSGIPKMTRVSRSQQCWGTWIDDTQGVDGVYSYNKAFTSTSLPDAGDCLFAPTLLGPGVCPLEIVTLYFNNGSETEHKVVVFDHVAGDYIKDTEMEINASFLSTYTSNGYYIGEILEDNGEWYALIYNWSTYSWEAMYGPQNGKALTQDGWCMFETHQLDTGSPWPTVPVVKANYLTVRLGNNNWQRVTPTYGHVMTPDGYLPYTRDFYNDYYYWYCGGTP